ncbi:MAG: hypothetical protein Q4B70_15955, partial [Lachnospiraceae bacterium]|nr:hypothetical protein [Lachnospiraceae bacterium]
LREGTNKKGRVALRFGFYVFIRGLYLFHLNEVNNKLYKKIKLVLESETSLLTGHPMEIIYKYMSFIASYKNDFEYAKMCVDKIESVVPYRGLALDAIVAYGKYEGLKNLNEKEKSSQALDEFIISMKKIDDNLQSLSNEDILKITETKMTFMYI